MKLIVASILVVSSLCTIVGCGNEKKPATTPSSQGPTLTSAPIKKAADNIGVSEDLAKACKLQLNDIASAPKFDFDKSDLADSDRSVLSKVAECLTTGPLKGRHVKLIGRADARGDSADSPRYRDSAPRAGTGCRRDAARARQGRGRGAGSDGRGP